MGMGVSALGTINELRRQNAIPLRGSVIEVGAQQLSNDLLRSRAELEAARGFFNAAQDYPFPEATPSYIAHGSHEALPENAPHAKIFWEWAGYEYKCVDIDSSPHSIPLDLNFDDAPREFRNRFDLVTNFGTTEHVANQLNAFKIIHDFTKPGGIMIHELPAQGHLNHGLVNYNPKFFWLLARSNEYRWIHMDFHADEAGYGVPDNIINHAAEYSGNARSRLSDASVLDCSVKIVFQKQGDAEYVPPIDVPSGVRTDNEMLKRRYGKIFNPSGLEVVHRQAFETIRNLLPVKLRRKLRASPSFRAVYRKIRPYS